MPAGGFSGHRNIGALADPITLNNENVVYVVQEDKTVLSKKVNFGLQEGWMVEITNGLEAGDRVIIVGQRNVSDGQKVNLIQTITDLKELSK